MMVAADLRGAARAERRGGPTAPPWLRLRRRRRAWPAGSPLLAGVDLDVERAHAAPWSPAPTARARRACCASSPGSLALTAGAARRRRASTSRRGDVRELRRASGWLGPRGLVLRRPHRAREPRLRGPGARAPRRASVDEALERVGARPGAADSVAKRLSAPASAAAWGSPGCSCAARSSGSSTSPTRRSTTRAARSSTTLVDEVVRRRGDRRGQRATTPLRSRGADAAHGRSLAGGSGARDRDRVVLARRGKDLRIEAAQPRPALAGRALRRAGARSLRPRARARARAALRSARPGSSTSCSSSPRCWPSTAAPAIERAPGHAGLGRHPRPRPGRRLPRQGARAGRRALGDSRRSCSPAPCSSCTRRWPAPLRAAPSVAAALRGPRRGRHALRCPRGRRRRRRRCCRCSPCRPSRRCSSPASAPSRRRCSGGPTLAVVGDRRGGARRVPRGRDSPLRCPGGVVMRRSSDRLLGPVDARWLWRSPSGWGCG